MSSNNKFEGLEKYSEIKNEYEDLTKSNTREDNLFLDIKKTDKERMSIVIERAHMKKIEKLAKKYKVSKNKVISSILGKYLD